MEMALAPRASFANNRRHMLQVGAGDPKQSLKAPQDQRRTVGWRRISSGHKQDGNGSTADHDSGEGRSEVWEWNGRRVVIHVSPPQQPPSANRSEGEAATAGDREDGKLIF